MHTRNNTFLIFMTACFGDVLLCSTLCQNIKHFYPDAKVVFIVDKPCYDAAKYHKDVGDVVIYDKKGENKGIIGLIKFIIKFKYKFAYASFLPYSNIRNWLISFFCGIKHIIMEDNKDSEIYKQKKHANLISKLTQKDSINFPMRYITNKELNPLNTSDNYIVLCPLTKREEKNIPVETSAKLIELFSKNQIVLTGKGKNAEEYAKILQSKGCKFINMVNKTNIPELASILKDCKMLISANTGTMHLGCAVGCPVTAVFYEQENIDIWQPRNQIYNSLIINENQSPENIYNQISKKYNV